MQRTQVEMKTSTPRGPCAATRVRSESRFIEACRLKRWCSQKSPATKNTKSSGRSQRRIGGTQVLMDALQYSKGGSGRKDAGLPVDVRPASGAKSGCGAGGGGLDAQLERRMGWRS